MANTNWQNLPNTTTPINATNLNKISAGLVNIGTEADDTYNTNLIKSKNLWGGDKLAGYGISSGGIIASATDNDLFYIPVVVGKTYVFSFTDNGVSGNIVWGYTSQVPANGVSCTYNVMTNASLNGATFTPTGTQKYLCIRLNTSTNNQYKAMDNIQIEEGSTATSYEAFIPNQIVVDDIKYTDTLNVGASLDSRSRVNVLKSNNLFDLDYYFNNVPANNCTKEKTTTGIKLNFTAGADAFVGWAGKSGQTVTDVTKSYLIKVKPSTTYTIALSTGTRNSSYITYISNDFNVINSNYVPLNSIFNYTFTTASNCYYIALRFGVSDNSITTYTFSDIRLTESSSALPYEPYVVPSIYVDNEMLVSKNVYSAGEVVIGEWLGKPLYRQVFAITSLTSSNTNLVDISGLSIDFAKISGTIITSTGAKFPINLYDSASNYSVIIISDSGYIRGRGAIGSGTLSKCIVILEYTKRTDV